MNLTFLLIAGLAAASAEPLAGTSSSRQAQAEYLRGTLLERRGAYGEALAAYEKAMSMDPSAAFIAGEAAELALQLEDRAHAETWARKRLELAPNDAKSRVILGRVLWARGDSEGAEAEFEKALKNDPSSADTLFALAELIAHRDPKRARKHLENFLAQNPDHAARALFELGRLDAQEERYKDAIDKLQRAIDLDRSAGSSAQLALAQVYEVTHDTVAALNTYQKLLAEDPEDIELWAHIGELQASLGQKQEARDTFHRLKEKYHDDPLACEWLANDAEKSGDFARAAAELKDSRLLATDPTLNLRLGYYLLQAKGIPEALNVLAAARKRWPKDDRIAFYLALGRDDLGDHAEAVKLLREVLSFKPEDRDARWQLATILEKMNNIAEAEVEFRRLLADKPEDAPALNYLGYSLADRGLKLEEALGFIRRALVIEPTNAAYRDSLGWVLFKLGRSTEAVRELEASARVIGEDESVWDHLGDAYFGAGLKDQAWRSWRLAQSLGSQKTSKKAEALQKNKSAEEIGELWRAHFDVVHGGVKRYSAVCAMTGHLASHDFDRQVLLTYRSPMDLTLEILGPMFSPVARAHVGIKEFRMDPIPVAGVSAEEVHGAAENVLTMVADLLAAEPYLPGPAAFDSGWTRRSIERPAWRIDIDDSALVQAVTGSNGVMMTLSDFEGQGLRHIPRTFSAKGRAWDFSLSCHEPKIEVTPAEILPQRP